MVRQLLDNLKNLDNWEDVRVKFGEMINLGEPAPSAVVSRALADQKFAYYLVLTKDSPSLRAQLLDDPRNLEYEEKAPERNFSNAEILTKASGALVKWAKAGFTQVNAETYTHRLDACKACPFLKEPPKKALYKASKLTGGDQSICGKCGCVVARKAKLPTESCPAQDPVNATLSRWGEAFGR